MAGEDVVMTVVLLGMDMAGIEAEIKSAGVEILATKMVMIIIGTAVICLQ